MHTVYWYFHTKAWTKEILLTSNRFSSTHIFGWKFIQCSEIINWMRSVCFILINSLDDGLYWDVFDFQEHNLQNVREKKCGEREIDTIFTNSILFTVLKFWSIFYRPWIESWTTQSNEKFGIFAQCGVAFFEAMINIQ